MQKSLRHGLRIVLHASSRGGVRAWKPAPTFGKAVAISAKKRLRD